jgi:hypothetical protein
MPGVSLSSPLRPQSGGESIPGRTGARCLKGRPGGPSRRKEP